MTHEEQLAAREAEVRLSGRSCYHCACCLWRADGISSRWATFHWYCVRVYLDEPERLYDVDHFGCEHWREKRGTSP